MSCSTQSSRLNDYLCFANLVHREADAAWFALARQMQRTVNIGNTHEWHITVCHTSMPTDVPSHRRPLRVQ